jgi:heterodisulfide reductase subunit A-like polyferredoxin
MANSPDKYGAVLVVGGGVAGAQASLDLAEMGFYVYLAEKNPAIGGRMAQLDKVFPTNDCAMCVISPKLNDVGSHVNIETLTRAEVLEVSGEPGRFVARVRQEPRYLDGDKCSACGDCATVCPVSLPFEFNQNLNSRKATFKSYAQAFPNSFSLSKEDVSPCVVACPAHVNAHAYVSLASQGLFQEALTVILDALPLPGVLGRVCANPCETKCRRGQLEGPLAIRDIKRLVADQGDLYEAAKTFAQSPLREEKVAIVGAGPSGLSCAFHLARRGIKSDVFEATEVAGGALRLGIPDYRLPSSVLQKEIDFILEFSGANIKFNAALGKDFTLDTLEKDGYKAIFLAMGAQNNHKLHVPGEDSPGVLSGVEFLKDLNLGALPDLKGKKVLIIGGGNVALDAARSAIRLGAEATLAYRRGVGAMPAWSWEIREALEEGLKIAPLRAPWKFAAKGGKVMAYLAAVRVSGDPNDREAALAVDFKDISQKKYDLVIAATGQKPSTESLQTEPLVKLNRDGSIAVDPISFATGRRGVFAGGDAQLGPSQAIDAIAAGKEAAISIERYFNGQDLREGREPIRFTGREKYRDIPENEPTRFRAAKKIRPPLERKNDFAEFDLGLSADQVLSEASRCLSCGACCRCFRCVKACQPAALTQETHAQKAEIRELEVGAVILAPGFDPFDPRDIETYRYLNSPNIVTSLEFERILSASGPFQGEMARPGDRSVPQSVAWLQCVGSRDINRCDRRYCSSVCCMYALKEATIAMEHAGEGALSATVFYMDIRAHGKDFEKYYNRAVASGVNFVRSRVHTLTPLPNGDVSLEYLDESGAKRTQTFNMAVLSVGLSPSPALAKIARNLNIGLNGEGFIETLPFQPVATTRPGFLACGAATEPKDIPTTVMEASAAAQSAGQELAEARFTRVKSRFYPAERDTLRETPRIGVFVCHCGVNIASVVSVEEVVSYARDLPFVELCADNLFTCSADSQAKIKDAIRELKLNRVVVASCSPRTHEGMFRETLAQAGLNKYLFEMANIRDQDSWVHQKEPRKATQKAKDLVRAAVAKAALLEPMFQTRVDVTREALVVGGGVAGLTAALSVAEMGFPAHLVEKSSALGGNALKVYGRNKDFQSHARALIEKALTHPLIKVYLRSAPLSSEGFVGNFETVIAGPQGELRLKHGVTILAPGGQPHLPQSHGYGALPSVLLALDLDALLSRKDPLLEEKGKTFAFLQCVESRDEARPYCSKICCSHTLENALSLLDLNPEAKIYVFYRDVRSYGFREKLYQEARARGVRFIRYLPEAKPEIAPNPQGGLDISVQDHVLNRPLFLTADFLILASGVDPAPMKKEIVDVFKGQLNAEGFLLEAHAKLRPVDLATDGQFLAGLAHYPKPLEESVAQAKAAAARAAAVLAKPYLLAGGVVAEVDPAKCAACLSCVRSCPVRVPKIVPNPDDPSLRGNAYMEPAICQGCGVCVSECPGKAIKLRFFTDEQLLAKVAALADSPQIAAN